MSLNEAIKYTNPATNTPIPTASPLIVAENVRVDANSPFIAAIILPPVSNPIIFDAPIIPSVVAIPARTADNAEQSARIPPHELSSIDS